MREDIELWKAIIDEWPEPPRDEPERVEREATYWQRETEKYLVQGRDGSPSLRPRQTILDMWWNDEKWNFRRYYAATGEYRPSVFGEVLVRANETLEREKVDITTTKTGLPHIQERRRKANAELEHFWNVVVPNHREKWGNWYLFNVEQMFSKRNAGPKRAFDRPSDDL